MGMVGNLHVAHVLFEISEEDHDDDGYDGDGRDSL